MSKEYSNLFIWDSPDKKYSISNDEKVILWQSFSLNNEDVSIPELTEKWADFIRNEYLHWIYNLGKFNIGGEDIIQSLKIRESLSAWWIGLLVEKSNFSKSPYINDIVKLLTFKRWIKDKKIYKITLYSSNKNLAYTLNKFCLNEEIIFEYKKEKKEEKEKKSIVNIKKIFFLLPHVFRGLIWFIYKIIYSFPLRNKNIKDWQKINKKYIFVSYLFNMKNSDNKKFSFSTYWGELPKKLKDNRTYTHWIHLYVKDQYLDNPKKASELINKLNKNNNFQKHITLYSFMNIRIIYKIFIDWLILLKKIKKIQIYKKFPLYEGLDFWLFYKDDWYDSFIGKTSIDNLIYLNLFQEALKLCNKSTVISYLLENQGWEIGMLSVCKSLNIERTIGFSHAASRFWDLRNFYDKNEFNDYKKLRLPMPKILAVNNKFSLEEFISFGYPKNQIRLVEALRHFYLTKDFILRIKSSKNRKSILVLGDYENNNTKNQISILNNLSSDILKDLNIIYKPHPASSLDIKKFPNLSINLREDPISELLPLTNLVFCGSVTSASLDAFAFGSKVIIYKDPRILNFSPLRKFDDATFVIDSIELEEIIIKFFSGNIYRASRRAIFELSEDLPLWKNLLFETVKI